MYFLYSTECFNETFGINCSERCFCMNGGTCNNALGCLCTAGWTGANCSIGKRFVTYCPITCLQPHNTVYYSPI